jgi:hypothetical protein
MTRLPISTKYAINVTLLGLLSGLVLTFVGFSVLFGFYTLTQKTGMLSPVAEIIDVHR